MEPHMLYMIYQRQNNRMCSTWSLKLFGNLQYRWSSWHGFTACGVREEMGAWYTGATYGAAYPLPVAASHLLPSELSVATSPHLSSKSVLAALPSPLGTITCKSPPSLSLVSWLDLVGLLKFGESCADSCARALLFSSSSPHVRSETEED